MGDVLNTGQLKKLAEHKYSAEGTSVLEPYMQKFWRWLVEQVPLWWAPNAITLTGLVMNVITTLILICYSPDAKQEAPWWAHIGCALGLFVYQMLDAIDGKQARRTGSSSPLGELFDHGCDGLSIVFVVLGTCISVHIGTYPAVLFFECFATMFMFYASHWQTYCSGTMKFGFIDVTEAQFAVMSVFIISGTIGSGWWTGYVPILGLELKLIPVFTSLAVALLACRLYFRIILVHGGVGKSGSTVAGTSVLSPVLPMAIMLTLAFVIWQKSPSHVYENHPVLYILSFGMMSAKITNRLIIAHMTKSEMDKFDSSMVGPLLLFLNQYFNCMFDEYYVLWLCFVYCTLDLLYFSVQVCQQICDYLNISCFTITVPTDGRTSATNGTSKKPSRPNTRLMSKLSSKK